MAQIEAAKRAAAAIWKCGTEDVSAQDLSSRYPWVHRHSVLLVVDVSRRSMIVAVNRSGRPLTFYGPGNLDTLNELFRLEETRLPKTMSPEQLAETVRTLVRGPGGFVGSESFWEQQKDAMNMWTSRSPTEGPNLFKKYCQGPVLARSDDRWTLMFFYFNNQGGVEEWKVVGDARKIIEATPLPVVPNGTFMFPYG